ncbi:mitochondrial ornithine transporter 1-like [Osmerus eperlanus]|uniref:mitochondrial ornithine transporter 1-like n=1 Tax=Osmerus eperlanus TaxID=29151 RepID=UPI002E10E805
MAAEERCSLHSFTGTVIDFMAGAMGGVACVLSGQPFDTVKVKMQTFPRMYRGFLHCSLHSYRQDGLRGLYRGTAAALLSNVAENAVLFACYSSCQQVTRVGFGLDEHAPLSDLQSAVAGSLASVASSLVLSPTELVKCRLQALSELRALGRTSMETHIWAVAREIVKAEGGRGLMQGLTSTWLREVPGYFFFFGGYETCRTLLTPAGGRKEDLDAVSLLVSGGVGGSLFWLSVYPVDSVKSRIQVLSVSGPQPGFLRTMATILRTEGVCALYCGLTPTVLRAFPSNGALFLAYEWTRRALLSLASTHPAQPDP